MSEDNFGFYFEKQGLAGTQGPNDPSGEYFSSTEVAESLTREVIQNCLDARADPTKPVKVVFELRTMSTTEVPGISGLRAAFAGAIMATKNLQGAKYMQDAGTSAAKKVISVLRIGDYGTIGLGGTESVQDSQSALSTLTRSTGASLNDGQRGGSFGIGSAVGPFASQMRTVSYISLPTGKGTPVFAATTKLASHVDKDGIRRQGTGYFTNLDDTSDFQYLRGLDRLDGFQSRTEAGTDVYIFDYRDAQDDSGLLRIKRAAVENFFVAIERGRLVVEALTDEGGWTLDASTLKDVMESDELLSESVLPYFMALTEGDLVEAELPHVGTVELRVWVSDSLTKKYGTQVMRAPLMKVQIVPSAFHVPFAAVFICANETGNQVLRETEPPTHDKWSDRGPRANSKAVGGIKRFIREELGKLLPEHAGAKASIKGLAALLPQIAGVEEPGVAGDSPSAKNTPGNDESPVVLGRPELVVQDPNSSGQSIITIQRSGRSDPEATESGTTGKRGGDKPTPPDPRPPRPGPPTPVAPGEGRSRIRSREVRFRSFADSRSGESILVLTAFEDVEGDLELAALGGGEREVFSAELASVVLETATGLAPQDVKGAVIRDLKLKKDVPVRMHVVFMNGTRYRLGVKDE